MEREELIELIRSIRRAIDDGRDSADLLRQLRAAVEFPRIEELVHLDYSPEYIADRSRLWRRLAPDRLSDVELAGLIVRVRTVDGSEAEVDAAMDALGQCLRNPEWRKLVGDWSKEPSEVVRLARSYRGPDLP